MSKMKFILICILFLFPMNMVHTIGPGTITDCFFINNDTEAIELVGIQTKKLYTKSNCFSQFFVDVSWEINRAKVKLLKTGAISGSSLSEALYKSFKNLRILDISHFGVKQLTSAALNLLYLEELNASHNNLTSISEWNFLNLPKIKKIDFSFNKITALYSNNFRRALKLSVINVSNNKIAFLGPETFRSLKELRVLRLSDNFITTIDKNTFSDHKLEVLQLENNPIAYIDCKFLSLMNISLNNVKKIDISCLSDSVQIDLDGKDDVVFRIPSSNSELRCAKANLKNVTFLSISGNRMQNTSKILELMGSSIESLDVASNFIGKLNSQTLIKFDNLQYLNLSHTNLSNFGFKTFYHQKKLKSLDVSYNHMKKVNFTLLLRNFKNLTTLNLEGNDLMEINSVTRSNFPSLSFLGISKNRFSCDYLATFLRQWESLQLFHNPSDETHIDGVDCYHEDEKNDKRSFEDDDVMPKTDANREYTMNKIETIDSFPQTAAIGTNNNDSSDFRVIERVLLVLCIVCCGYLVLRKSKAIQEIKQKLTRMSLERNVAYRNGNRSSQNDVALIGS